MKLYLSYIFITLFFVISIKSQEIQITDINEKEFPLIKVNLQINNNGNFISDSIKVFDNKKLVNFKIDSISTKKEGKTVLFLLDNEYCKNKVSINRISTLISGAIKNFSQSDFVNININVLLEDECVFPLSFEFTDKFNEFSNKIHQYLLQLKPNDKPNDINCSIEQSLNYLNSENTLTDNKYLIVMLNKLEQNTLNIKKIETIAYDFKIKLKIVVSEKINFDIENSSIFIVNHNYDVKKLNEAFINSININNNKYLYASNYTLKFYTKQNKNINKFKIYYKNNTVEDKFTQPRYINYLKNNWLLTTFIIIFFIVFTLTTTYLYFTKKIISTKLTELQNSFKIRNSGISDNIISNKNGLFPEIKIKIAGKETIYEIKKLIVKIGRSADNDIIIDDLTISNKHAIITNEGGEFFLQDIGSTNGVFVNDIKITKSMIKTTDKIRMGKVALNLIY